jgi:predicted ArsR family transcriptional regulator
MAVSERDVGGVGALADPVRRDLYEFVCGHDGPVSRDVAADALAMPRHQAKFHLDRLEQAGLLDAAYARPDGRGGPGAGRPAKLYRRSAREIAVSLPERDYELASRLLAEAIVAVTDSAGDGGEVPDLLDALDEAAAAHGIALAGTVCDANRDLLGAAVAALEDHGYEPRRDGDRVFLVNCPFHAIAKTHTALVCRMNHALLGAMTEAMEPGIEARLEPGSDRCCVVLAGRGA